MPSRRALRWLCVLGFAPTACALAGYDFGDYQRASTGDSGGATSRQTTANTASVAGAADGGAGGEASSSAGAPSEHPIGPEPTTFGVGGTPSTEQPPEGGAGGSPDGCQPASCQDQAAECGSIDDGCGQALDCGGCFWWFLECRENLCQFTE